MKAIDSETDPKNVPHIFVVGDRVRLKSNGPDMTVTKLCHTVDHLAYIDCTWFPHVDSPLPSTHRFPQDAVERWPSVSGSNQISEADLRSLEEEV